ncbi:hypothetical protein Cgig2_001735 [Carnegiea gigantea]|uniref:Uncharacterized protein n=1 Tax=Carnegiea gigantea TaxID=171969 RepID=A0A9Q1GN22_9CARY|nr:hypothetical protein Cgig2_001735 [Carnegiea gigantea]
MADSKASKNAAVKAQQWRYDTGSNENKAGKQKTGRVRIDDRANGSGDGLQVTHTGSSNTGGSINHGTDQETGILRLLSADIGQPGDYNTGDNVHDNSEGKEKTGNVRIGNRANESGGPINVSNSKNINTGRNKSGGKDGQETGNIEIGNVG